MHKSATKCNKTVGKWCKNKHGASKIIDTFETYQEPLPKNELLDIFYNGLTVESKTYLDSCAGGVFRIRTPAKAEELIAKISQNYDD
jgi:hypothetical protein